MKHKIIIAFLLLALIYCTPAVSIAQTGPTDPGGDPDQADVPIDGGLSVLLAAGVGYYVKKGYDKRRKETNSKMEQIEK